MVSQVIPLNGNDAVGGLGVSVKSRRPACVTAHLTTFFNIIEPQEDNFDFAVEVSTKQGRSKATAQCTTAMTTVCLRSMTNNTNTGMLMAALQLPSGWTVSSGVLDKIAVKSNLQKLEIN